MLPVLPTAHRQTHRRLMVVDLNQFIAFSIAEIVDSRLVGGINHDHEGVVVNIVFNHIGRAKPVKSWILFPNAVDLFRWKARLQDACQPHLGANGVRVRPLVAVNNNGVMLFDQV